MTDEPRKVAELEARLAEVRHARDERTDVIATLEAKLARSVCDRCLRGWHEHRRSDAGTECPASGYLHGVDSDEIAEWATSTFGSAASNARVAARANEEMAELLRVLTADDASPKAPEEAADVVIVLCRIFHRFRTTLGAEVARKMEVNRARVWKKDGTGHGYHVREKA